MLDENNKVEEALTGPFAKEGMPQQAKVFVGATKHQMKFSGTGNEYFKIWIVNLVLSLLTLGIYSAWATVRTKKYFYGNTFIDDSSFDYHATPKQILIGRIIAVSIFILVVLLGKFSPALSVLFFFLLFILVPVIIQRSIRFNHAVTSIRNVRFGFDGTGGEAYVPYFLWPIASAFTANILYPLMHHSVHDYRVNNTRYGNLKFRAQLDGGFYFMTYLKMVGMCILLLLGVVVVSGIIGTIISVAAGGTNPFSNHFSEDAAAMIVFIPLGFAYGTIILFAKSFIEAVIRKHYFSKSYVAGIANLDSTMKVASLYWIFIKNTVLLLLTLGIYYPWAKVNLTRYRVENTIVHLSDDVGAVISEQQELSSFSDELGDVFDVDAVGGF